MLYCIVTIPTLLIPVFVSVEAIVCCYCEYIQYTNISEKIFESQI